ncbi:MAG: hypothetical protein AB4368_26995 [Xenococcaceae cyanobacterium]
MSETKRLKVTDNLDIRCTSDSWLGQIIDYMQNIPSNTNSRDLAIEMLFARYLPLILDKSSPSNRIVAMECAAKCDSWAKVIREVWGLNETTPAFPTVISLPQTEQGLSIGTDTSSNLVLPEEEIKEKKELEKFSEMLQETVDSSSNAWEARDKLAAMEPENEEDWTEAQWELWNEYITQQENIIDKQMLGDLAEQLKSSSNDRFSEVQENKA